MKNKKASFFMVVALIVAFLVISIIASLLGLKFLSNILEDIKWEYLVMAIITILAIIFRDVIKVILLSLWTWIASIIGAIFK